MPMAQSYLEIFNPAAAIDQPRGKPMSFTAAPEAAGDNLTYLRSVLEAGFAASPSLQNIQFRATSRYLILSAESSGLFAAAGADLTPAARAMMFDLAGVLGNLTNPLAVVAGGAANAAGVEQWAIGLARADAVADALADAGYVGTMTALTRLETSGRIEFVILAEGTRE